MVRGRARGHSDHCDRDHAASRRCGGANVGATSKEPAASADSAGNDLTAGRGAKTAAPQMTMKEAKQKLGIVVFPAKEQTPEQQEADELACLQWAANEVGIHPNQPAPDAKAAGDQAKA